MQRNFIESSSKAASGRVSHYVNVAGIGKQFVYQKIQGCTITFDGCLELDPFPLGEDSYTMITDVAGEKDGITCLCIICAKLRLLCNYT